jgi:hypothetical protein
MNASTCSPDECLLSGEPDGSTCGDGWATWGQLFDGYEEYGLDEESEPPFKEDGFVRAPCDEVSRYQLCRFDSEVARSFSSCVAFTRRSAMPPEGLAAAAAGEPAAAGEDTFGNEEDLAASWERMQRSVAAGRAQRLDVQMQMDVTK